jgi:OOP family OmpA-OmpF porin
MKLFVSVLVLATLVLSLSVAPASAGGKEKAEARRAALAEKPDSRALCPLLAPWPWKCACADMDSDGDGVPDGKDQCPGTPLGAIVDKKGCPIDSDKDGVPDGIDKCPNTPAGVKVDAKGCPIDSDGDGVPDGIDKCPNTPAGAKVDETGCPIDSDGDGVPDGIDKCPNTPAGVKVDETGCPADVKAFIDTGKITSTKILFETGKADLKPESKRELDTIGAVLAQCADMKVEIAGHTDSQGADDINMKLSEARAAAVRDYILKNFKQCKPDLFVAKGYGETKPVATNATAEGRQQNRRVEFTIMK